MTRLDSILNAKYCDIDPSFGLHDYTISIELRNTKAIFFSETYNKVFTKVEQLEKPDAKIGSGWANFNLIQSESQDRYYSNNQVRFPGKPFYQFDNLITQN